MGMFDHLHVYLPLPGDPPISDFQTKDLDNCLDQYRITLEGHLEVLDHRLEDVPPSEWGPEPLDSGTLEHFFWEQRKFRSVEVGWRRVLHHGYVRFYGYTGDYKAGTQVWYEYRAKFTDGLCVEIVPVPEDQRFGW